MAAPGETKLSAFDEIWAVPVKRIHAFFLATDVGDCKVKIEAMEERKVGSFSFPQTRVMISGEGAEALHRRFVLNFISAGG